MSIKKITLSTHNIDSNCASRITTYCRLLHSKLKDCWETTQNSEDCQVVIKKYQPNDINEHETHLPTIYLLDGHSTIEQKKDQHKWYIKYPIYSHDLVAILNDISPQITVRKKTYRSFFSKKIIDLFSNRKHKKPHTIDPENNKQKETKQAGFVDKLMDKIAPEKRNRFKVVFLGSPGSGKTTAIQSVSKFAALTTEVKATDSVGLLKSNTTIGIDYGEFKHKGITLCLYGTPGQQRYDYMRRLSIKNAKVYVVLLDMTSGDPLSDLSYLNNLINLSANIGVIKLIALTHLDAAIHDPIVIKKNIINKSSSDVIVTQLDPRNEADVEDMLSHIAESIISNKSPQMVALKS